MPIRREQRFFYPIDWPQLSALVRFGRAGGRCDGYGRSHGPWSTTLGAAIGGMLTWLRGRRLEACSVAFTPELRLVAGEVLLARAAPTP